jgi:prolyl-tRNA editing enzyme YbaK/EbsC (Cys-tRNA(Pro) deacylase)
VKDRLSKNSFNFQFANEEDSYRLSGFEHNAISPYGLKVGNIPVLVDSRLLEISPARIYLGGGSVDMKLLVSVNDLVSSLKAKVGLISDSRLDLSLDCDD